jgi:GntR family transcriptional regulator, transcriptional repressor for pyruvate dehydrogenase complex
MTDGEDDILARVIDIAMELRPDPSGRIKLPTERELADQLGIQRPTLRDRLTVLETLGLLQRVQGSGTYLALPNSRFLQFYFGVALKLGFISIDQIQSAMEMIGREMAGAAAIHASAADFEELDRLIDEIAACETMEDVVELQFELHASLAKACRNPVIVIVIDGLSSVIRSVIANKVKIIAMVRGAFERNVEAYRALVQALRDREPDMARSAIQECYWLWRREESKVSILNISD